MNQTLVTATHKLSKLSFLQKLLLITDGTITPILEEYAQEELQVVKLSEKVVINAEDSDVLNIEETDLLLARQILLQGKVSKINFLYAESSIVLKHLEPWLKDKLLYSNIPIGKLLIENRVETFREILEYYQEPIGSLANYFTKNNTSTFISRKYKIIVAGRPIMLIKEKLPSNLCST